MLKIRLKRMGAKKAPFYRMVVAENTSPRDGRFKESIGYYNPLTNPAQIEIDRERAQYWLSVGAQPTDRVARILKFNGFENVEVKLRPAKEKAEKKDDKK